MADRHVVPVVTVDGPGGSGKGTISRAVARELGWHLLDSGALYRLVALLARTRGLDMADHGALAEAAARLDVRFDGSSEGEGVWLEGTDVSWAIRSEECGAGASAIAEIPAVRAALLDRQRAFRQLPGLVADGRDMGTVVFPDAGLKIFLTASVEERARRRHKQLRDKGIDVSLSALSRDMAARDRRDSERAVAPLRPSQDARLLDTTGVGVSEVVSQVLNWIRDAFAGQETK